DYYCARWHSSAWIF
nr:immunoglobulin light chain junction region [Macaca mulatta]